MLVKLPLSNKTRPNLWAVELDRNDVRHFGRPGMEVGQTTIIGVLGPVKQEKNGIEFDTSYARILNLGDGTEVVVLDLEQKLVSTTSEQSLASGPDPLRNPIHFPISTDIESSRSGDEAFFRACDEEGLPDSVVSLGVDLLGYVRSFSTDILLEGQNRKWYTKPKNFLAITIQNTKKRLCVHVKETKILDSLRVAEVHRDKRYVRLFLKTPAELPEIKKAVRASFHL